MLSYISWVLKSLRFWVGGYLDIFVLRYRIQVRRDGEVHDGGLVPVAVPGRGGAGSPSLRVRVLPAAPDGARRCAATRRQVSVEASARRRGTYTHTYIYIRIQPNPSLWKVHKCTYKKILVLHFCKKKVYFWGIEPSILHPITKFIEKIVMYQHRCLLAPETKLIPCERY